MFFAILIFASCILTILHAQSNPFCYRTYENPCYGSPADYQSGDAILPGLPTEQQAPRSRSKRGATAMKQFLWPNGTVYYIIHDSYTDEQKSVILNAMHHIENRTCVRFTEYNTNISTEGYINIFPGTSCCSYVGFIGCGKQGLSLHPLCVISGTVIHELLHALGFYHEHSRPDRDQYVHIIKGNIKDGAQINFEKEEKTHIDSLGIDYDYNSIMHYCKNSFSTSKEKATIVPTDPNAVFCGGCELSTLDTLQINLLYNCDLNNLPPISTPLQSKAPNSLPQLELPYPNCGQIFDGVMEGTFSSPGYKNGIYPHNTKCAWVFRARKGYSLNIKLTISLEFISDCSKDFVQAFYNQRSTRKYCGEVTLSLSKVTELRIQLTTDGSNRHSSRTYKGITGSFSSDDINECSLNSPCSHKCKNTEGSYQCTCPAGLYLSNCNGKCLDINECIEGGHDCDLKVSSCKNNYGSHSCVCHHGYQLDTDQKTCKKDSTFCEINNGGCSQICNQTEANVVTCSCKPGYRLNTDNTTCDDINECSEDTDNCLHYCVNTIGSYYCGCLNGYVLNSDQHSCSDINECKTLPADSLCNDVCFNTIGGYFCYCSLKSGFGFGPGFKSCIDINECDANNGGCGHICINTVGSYKCLCNEGFVASTEEIGACVDIDECSLNDELCDHSCVNEIGSYTCSCAEGYKLGLNGRSCKDINECNSNISGCEHICTNTLGSFVCSCYDGYLLGEDKLHCQDINECKSNPCSHKCTNTQGSFSCNCPEGYIMSSDNSTCTVLPTPSTTTPTTTPNEITTPTQTPTPPLLPMLSCGSNFTSDNGLITFNNTKTSNPCVWRVELQDQSKYMELNIDHMNFTPSDTNCSKCYIEVFNGESSNDVLEGRYCGKSKKKIVSAINKVTIRYQSTVECTGTFTLSYQSTKAKRTISNCNSIIFPRKGELVSSANFPKSPPAYQSTCNIYVFARGVIRFTLLYIGNLQDCSESRIDVYSSFVIEDSERKYVSCNHTSYTETENNMFVSYTGSNLQRGFLGKIEVF